MPVLGRAPLLVGDPARKVARIAWCSGGAQDYFEAALATGADIFVSGEISEQTVHLARETGMAYIAAGHHATERYGVMALGAPIWRKNSASPANSSTSTIRCDVPGGRAAE
jgi:putative NIF3 family GTP cyclohydrolase 1 type 2